MLKCVLTVAGPESNEDCGKYQLCRGMESIIEGGIHSMHIKWQQNDQDKDWSFLLIYARNEFNGENRTEILWIVRFEFPSGVSFTLNYHLHWAILVIYRSGGWDNYLTSSR